MMHKIHAYGTDIPVERTTEEIRLLVERTINWTIRSLGISHLIEPKVECSQRFRSTGEKVCDNILLELREIQEGTPRETV